MIRKGSRVVIPTGRYVYALNREKIARPGLAHVDEATRSVAIAQENIPGVVVDFDDDDGMGSPSAIVLTDLYGPLDVRVSALRVLTAVDLLAELAP